MSYLLDTDICIFWLKSHPAIKERLLAVGWNQVSICVVTVAELYYGAYNSSRVAENLVQVERLVQQLPVVPLQNHALNHFGEIKTTLRRQGQSLPDFDLLIASVALAEDYVLVTNNLRHYQRITGLRVETWIPPDR
jgi:tRNA(fMet)-specific endonuclease VapC